MSATDRRATPAASHRQPAGVNPMTPIEKTAFLSPRNVPLWMGLAMAGVFVVLILAHV